MDRNSDVRNEKKIGTEMEEKGGTKIINLTLMDRNSDVRNWRRKLEQRWKRRV